MKTSPVIVKFFADYISSQLGIIYSETNYYQLETRLQDVATIMGLADAEELYALASKGFSPKLKGILLDHATNNETLFFRDPPAFTALEKTIEAEAQNLRGRTEPFRVWSAACSFGQEVYSLAMILNRMHASLPAAGFEIVATDVSSRALKAAEEGIYSDMNVERGLDPVLKDRYFSKITTPTGDAAWQVRPELRKGLRFLNQNLLDPFDSLGTFDLILCRNVLIYQTTDSRKEIVKKLYGRLRPGGVFLLGSSESLLGISEDFDTDRHERATIYRRRVLLKAS